MQTLEDTFQSHVLTLAVTSVQNEGSAGAAGLEPGGQDLWKHFKPPMVMDMECNAKIPEDTYFDRSGKSC